MSLINYNMDKDTCEHYYKIIDQSPHGRPISGFIFRTKSKCKKCGKIEEFVGFNGYHGSNSLKRFGIYEKQYSTLALRILDTIEKEYQNNNFHSNEKTKLLCGIWDKVVQNTFKYDGYSVIPDNEIIEILKEFGLTENDLIITDENLIIKDIRR